MSMNIDTYPLRSFQDEIKQYITCVVCLEILNLNNSLMCQLCNSPLCEGCLQILTMHDKRCFGKCEGNYRRANKYVRDLISNVEMQCENCNQKMSSQIYSSETHLSQCNPEKLKKINLFKALKKNGEDIIKIKKEIDEQLILYSKTNKLLPLIKNPSKLLKLSQEMLRNHLMTFNLHIDKKMEMYHCATQGNLEQFKVLVLYKKYPLLEEISYKNFFWTALHYAMHFGQCDLICFIIDILIKENLLEPVLRLQSNDGRCPLLCLLKSNHTTASRKEELFTKLLIKYNLPLSKEVKKEASARGYEKFLKKLGK